MVCLFGIGSWIAINGIWVELPNLVNEVPEKWKLASYLTVMCQLANIGPIFYALVKKYFDQIKFERYTIYVLLVVGFISCMLLSFLWKKTLIIFNKERSIALLTLFFFVALVDCTSSVTFLPFMSMFAGIYLSPFYVGETLSGLVPSFVALAQGVSASNQSNMTMVSNSAGTSGMRFPQEVFFLILALLIVVCFFSFIALNYVPGLISSVENYTNIDTSYLSDSHSETDVVIINTATLHSFKSLRGLLLVLMAWLNTLQNGIISSISSFACAPYGPLAYHLGKFIHCY